MKLFREEVLSARAGRWLGGVQLAQSVPAWLACMMALVLAASLLAYGFIGSYARKAHVTGILAPRGGEINIQAPASGRVAELRVKEGQQVASGDILMVLDTDKTALLVGESASPGQVGDTAALVSKQLDRRREGIAAERASRVSQADVRSRAIQDRLLTLDSELAKLTDEIALQARRRDLAQRSVQRYEALVSSDFVSPVQLQTQQETLIDQDARLRSLERARLNLQRERGGLVADGKQITADLATVLAGSDREAMALAQEATENTARRTTVVVAPRAGTVSAVAVGQGQWSNAGQTLAAMQPLGEPLEAQLYAASRTAGFVAPGQRVLIRYAAYPYQKFGLQAGQVTAISQSAFAPSDLPPSLQAQFGRQAVEAMYRVTVKLDSQSIATYGDARPLRAGMALDADIVQDRRSIIEWVLEPLFAVAKR